MNMHPIVAAAALMAFASAAGAQESAACPDKLPAQTQCWKGRDANGAYYWIARPREWNGVLVVHSHGGPRTAAPRPDSEVEDLDRFAVVVAQGFAFAASSYREGGYLGIEKAAEDSENLRRIYIAKFGVPRRTLAHGQSWGGGVAAYLIERYGATEGDRRPYDGAMLTSGLVAGNALAYDYRADLRAVYQYYCHNHPRPDEPQYPVWMGLPPGAKMSPREVGERVDACTGVSTGAGKRTPEQKRNLHNILSVVRITEKSLIGNMNWSTFLFQDIVRRLDGRNPFSNAGVRYAGSDDDEALNKGVIRFEADPEAVRRFSADGRLTGKVDIPVLTMHAIEDPTVFVEQDSTYRATLEGGGSAANLVQTWTRESEHSYLSTPEYSALLEALMAWVDRAEKPSPRSVASLCEKHAVHEPGGCHFDVEFHPRPLDTRRYPR
jgi:pimeloyl-ACP methyl ester carboxylesterase